MNTDNYEKWFEMPLKVQLGIVGGEVNRAIYCRQNNESEKAARFCKQAIEYLRIIKMDPKNVHRQNEFNEAILELEDHFLGKNLNNTTDETIRRYYSPFIWEPMKHSIGKVPEDFLAERNQPVWPADS